MDEDRGIGQPSPPSEITFYLETDSGLLLPFVRSQSPCQRSYNRAGGKARERAGGKPETPAAKVAQPCPGPELPARPGHSRLKGVAGLRRSWLLPAATVLSSPPNPCISPALSETSFFHFITCGVKQYFLSFEPNFPHTEFQNRMQKPDLCLS